METKQYQQKPPTIKKSDLNLDAFLHSVMRLPIKDNNKQFIFNTVDTNDVKFSLNKFLDFNPINNYFKLYVSSCMNRTILIITFKFIARLNRRFIYICYYTPRKKQWLFNHFVVMCRQGLLTSFNIKTFYIDFLFLFLFFFLFFFFRLFKLLDNISWNFVLFFCYISIIWKVWEFLWPYK
jgi:hypothetical protein